MRILKSPTMSFAIMLAWLFSCSAPPVRPLKDKSGDLKGIHPGTGEPSVGESGSEDDDTVKTGEPSTGGSDKDEPSGTGQPQTGEDPGETEPKEPKEPKQSLLFVSGGSEEIRVYKFDRKTGAATLLKTNPVPNIYATFLAVHPASKAVFAVDERGSQALMFSLDPETGALKELSRLPTSGGPAHLSVDANGKTVYAADYGAGAVHSFSVSNQTLVAKSQKNPGKNAHAAQLEPSGKTLFVPCLGSGYIAQYSVDGSGTMTEASPATLAVGSKGPRHLAFHPGGTFVFLMNEYEGSVQALTFDGKSLKLNGNPVASTVSPVAGNTGAEIQVHPNGKFLYSSNRGDDSIALYKINTNGTVTFQKTVKAGGKTPRHFAIDPSGSWMTVANQDSNNVTLFQIDAETGSLTAKTSAIDYVSAQYAEIFDFY